MTTYTNARSLQIAYGENEVEGLTQDPGSLPTAAALAQGEVDTYLHSAGYVLPLTFTEAVDDTPSTLPGLLQKCSDAFTAFHLASSEDLHKQKYDTDRQEALKYLESLLDAKLRLVYPDGTAVTRVDPADGHGMVVVKARPRVFDQSAKPARCLFTKFDGTQ